MSTKDRKKNRKKTKKPTGKDSGRQNGQKKETTAKATAVPTSSHSSASTQQLPIIGFPGHLSFPSDDFLRNESPYEESFQAALETSYLGLTVDPPSLIEKKYNAAASTTTSTASSQEPPLAVTLQEMNRLEYFQADVTQPFGLGTKCAKTYVTRCLVGDPGTTYKYLGLRMFAYTWDTHDNHDKRRNKDSSHLCQEIGSFQKKILVPRTQHHLKELHDKRHSKYGLPIYPTSRSEAAYNICLINRMDSSNQDYKVEPFMEQDKIAVAWHADSSLQHYSNIAVYQLIVPSSDVASEADDESKDNDIMNDWSLAVRATPNAEGPQIQADHTPDSTIPALSLSLPSASAYYMLDDFNHHHQHAVLRTVNNNNHKDGNIKKKKYGKKKQPEMATTMPTTNNSPSSIRYSCTYRLLRPSHTVQEVLEQCRKVCAGFHKRGPKIWRSEQLLLFHIESEWLRQFYIQGQHHYDMLFEGNWDAPITQLWKYWAQLETRTRQTIDLLQLAAQVKASTTTSTTAANTPVPIKAERKKRDKQRKAYATVQDLLTRSSSNSNIKDDDELAFEVLYKPLVEQLQERTTMRGLWKKREKDHVFMTMEPRYRPLPWPVQYDSELSSATDKGVDKNGTTSTSSSIMAVSPLPEDLQPVADRLLAFGKAYNSGRGLDSPGVAAVSKTDVHENGTAPDKPDATTKSTPQQQQSKRKTKHNKKRKQKEKPPDATGKKKKRRF